MIHRYVIGCVRSWWFNVVVRYWKYERIGKEWPYSRKICVSNVVTKDIGKLPE